MRIHLLRHGTAEDAPPSGSDAERKLTEAGRDEIRRAVECARKASFAPSLILSSPYVRAVQTAEIAAGVLGYQGTIVRTDALMPSGSPARVWDEIRGGQDETEILLAGHEPLMSQLAAYFLDSPALQVHMRTATLVRIDMERFAGNPHGILKWMLPPDVWGG
jgi:phosphohistidine phosphatase